MRKGPRDSYEALAASIERVLRTDLAGPNISTHLAGSIDRIMLEEARAAELRLAWVRLVVIAPYVLLTLWALFLPGARGAHGSLIPAAVLAIVWLSAAGALVVALRRGWYRHWVPHLMPVLYAVTILGGFILWWRLDDAVRPLPAAELVAYVVVHCAFMCLSGALRLSRWSARAGTVFGVGVFVVVAVIADMSPLPAAAIALTLLASGLLASNVTTLVRRVITDEVARGALSRMYEQASEAVEAREQVLKIVSHDLRNPLNTISMTAALLLESQGIGEQDKAHLARIKRAGARMNRLIQDLLDVAKLESGRVAIDAKLIEVAPLIREAGEMLAPLAAEKSVRLDAAAAEGLPMITADAGRILQVLSNLAGNAIKFTPPEGRIVVRADPDVRGVRFSVRDTGPGIPPEQLTQIFGRFWQANPADRRGIGLGLTIAKGIVEAHGGRIWCESRVGEGTTFQFTLGTEIPPTASGAHERRRTGSVAPQL